MVLKDLIDLDVIFFSSTSKKQSKRINEIEPTRRLQSKDPWKSGWIRHFNKRFSMEYYEESIKKK